MYSQLLTFIVALLLFSIREPGRESLRPPAQTLFLGVAVFAAFAVLCAWSFGSLRRSLRRGEGTARISLRYHRAQTRLSILALGALAFDVYILDIKFFLQHLPGFQRFFTVSGLVGLGLYLLHLAVIWYWAYPVHQALYRSETSRSAFMKGHLSFYTSLLVPWFLIALASDLLQFVRMPPLLQTEPGQIFLFGCVFCLFLCFSPYLVVRFWGCEPLPPSSVRLELEAFCRQRGFRLGDFLLWPLYGGDHLTAAVLGVLPKLRYILITRGLLDLLTVEELKAVVSHEMGHVKRLHAFFYLTLFIAYAVVSSSFQDIILLLLLKHKTILAWATSPEPLDHSLFAMTYSLPILTLLVLYFRYLFGYFMRNCERQADLYALQVLGHPFTLVSSLQKIAFYSGQIEDLPSWHHFSIRQRIHTLLAAHEDPGRIKAHNRKLARSAGIFFAALTLLTFAGIRFQQSATVQGWRHEVRLRILENELNLKPQNPDLYMAYSGALMEKRRFQEAAVVLKRALKFAPNHPELLNNLAWLYATAPPPYRRPQEALDLALKAATIRPEPHILDTLAEAYFINGRFREALLIIRQAIAQEPAKMDYYLEQERKFLEALERTEETGSQEPGRK
ncbi:Tetratricopeptide repeat-containing protein [Desulfacinum hydrothermale DSM 13146]|uniref:Tetratricopeptide repeat-containing protein n=1 Tax=Desulfacinum hydrothermale DSM 13146 TaxID=1121390 RepID=A0A1W1XMU5_9BACT|nr:M48 family metallopeptidase [Desulfacinum hydrothermale]SMC25192.1 Tetratricopeptide repeat-containing protein [Desulfacinum hydrothermale DSM 13146]